MMGAEIHLKEGLRHRIAELRSGAQ